MRTKLLIASILSVIVGTVNAGTFTSLAIHSQVQNNSFWRNGAPSSVVSLKPQIPYAYFAIAASTSDTVLPHAAGASTASAEISATFDIQWKQSYIGEPAPATIYHHHSLASVAGYQVVVPAHAQHTTHAFASITGAPPLTGISATYAPPLSSTNTYNATSTGTFSFTPTWVYVSTDINGLATYQCTTPSIDSGTAYAEDGIQYFNGTTSITAQAASSATDNFYFDVV